LAGHGAISRLSQNDDLGRVVALIDSAYEDIQDKNKDWDWLRYYFTENLTLGDPTYNHTIVPTLANWKIDSIRCYLTTTDDEQYFKYIPWTTFRDSRVYGPVRAQTGRPHEFSVKPNNSIIVWPIPDAAYTLTGEYYRKAHVFTADADEPLFHRFHMVIVYKALMYAAGYLENPALYAMAQKEYNRLINKLENDRHEVIMSAGPLA